MIYLGSKNRIAKYILPIILKDRKPKQWYVEPFVGGANIIDKVKGKRIGNDINHYLIDFYRAIQCGWIQPKHISKEKYLDIKNNKDNYSNKLVGYVGHGLTFGAKWFDSYRADKKGVRDYSLENYNNIIKQRNNIKDVIFTSFNYYEMPIPSKSIIYCDPPYKGTTKGYIINTFDYIYFYKWCLKMAKQGHKVFVSEYSMPKKYFKCVWKKEVTSAINKSTKRIEKLFTVR